MPSPLASQTIARIQQALRTRESASLPEVINLIEELSSRAFSISVQELGDLIGRDTMVTAKIIQAANTFGFNPFGGAVTTIAQAIHVVGFNKIRNLALSMLLVENTAQGNSEDQRESAALALCSGLLAQNLSSKRAEQDPEQAFVFACLRHYGRLVLTTFLKDDFQQVQQRPATESEADACRRVFGLTPSGLTNALFEASRLPRQILRYLQDQPPSQIAAALAGPEDEMSAITQFSAALAELVVTSNVSSAEFAVRAEQLRQTFEAKLHLPADAIAGIVQAVDQGLRSFGRTYGSKASASGVLHRISTRAAEAEPLPHLPGVVPTASTSADAGAAPATPAPGDAAGTDSATRGTPRPIAPVPPAPDGTAILTEGLLQLSELMAASTLDVRSMESVALVAIQAALRLRDCLYFTRDGTKGAYAAQAGLGDLLGQIRGRAVIDAGRRDVFGICLTRREDVLIRDAGDPKLRTFLPEWLMGAGTVRSFILLPLVNESGAFALIVGTRTGAEPIQPNPRELQLLKAIRQHLTSARRIAGMKT